MLSREAQDVDYIENDALGQTALKKGNAVALGCRVPDFG